MLFIDTNIGIYRFYNKVTGKSYIGQSVDLKDRKTRHLYLLRHGKDGCSILQKAWDKYGEENFVYEVICYCASEELDDLEKKYITQFDSFGGGYNCDEGGRGRPGYHHTEETKRLLSEMSRGRIISDETRCRMSESQKGRKFTDEHRQKLRESWTDERKQKLSESFSGQNHPNYGKHGANAYCQVNVRCHTGEWFYTIHDAAKWCGLKAPSPISACLRGKTKHAGTHPETGEPLVWERIQK